MKFAYLSDIGEVRQINQDQACVLKNNDHEYFGIVCDGMGGHLAGELASKMAIDTLCTSFLETGPLRTEKNALLWLNDAIAKANQLIYEDAKTNPTHRGMGTTIVCCLYLKDSIIIAHVGDSRAYYYHDDSLQQLTKDHTYVNLLVDSGSITKEQAKNHPKKNILMKALGVFEEVVVSTLILENKHQYILLCSDGLYNCLTDDEIIHVLKDTTSIEGKVLQMIQLANLNGGLDNISVALMDGGEMCE